ncbi:hypothetical protein PPL_06680 [Heterostelium album PN500]|uniref:Uncharacterized protein n=1 Tax=Heterostelium pallidum (strain ATCC 26659 / Pp 5 / PN500) TaxID=670386 RepID=D3BFE6_HETP5|nr:hypothetical protein PPL_06680 [Heterostelium album PN500]EFA79860.1 hypothetical protein PPL_06680 [Heterostelium album PN500]|eukprot:XP_020431981.1 hypothetical protein PPL_06680 [Heterostelium album PN500]
MSLSDSVGGADEEEESFQDIQASEESHPVCVVYCVASTIALVPDDSLLDLSMIPSLESGLCIDSQNFEYSPTPELSTPKR